MSSASEMSEVPDMRGWFAEKEDEALWPGQRMALKVAAPLHAERTEFQDLQVFDSTNWGRVLVLDGAIQLTERDEASYQEMITHLPMFAHANPESVLIVGAGDGGVLREVCRHKGVKKVVMCEIDRRVVEASKKYFSKTMAVAFDDPRLELVFGDASKYVAEAAAGTFDVVIVDSSDPNDGPANPLFTDEFYGNVAKVLKPNGIVCTQGECVWLHLKLISELLRKVKKFYGTVDYAYTCTPTYPCGQIGFFVCSKSADPEYARSMKRAIPAEMLPQLKYYTPAMHASAFALPAFADAALSAERAPMKAAPKAWEKFAWAGAALVAGAAIGVAAVKLIAKRK